MEILCADDSAQMGIAQGLCGCLMMSDASEVQMCYDDAVRSDRANARRPHFRPRGYQPSRREVPKRCLSTLQHANGPEYVVRSQEHGLRGSWSHWSRYCKSAPELNTNSTEKRTLRAISSDEKIRTLLFSGHGYIGQSLDLKPRSTEVTQSKEHCVLNS